MADAVSKQAFAAAIFKRGQKAELFDDGGGGDEEAELSSKLSELHGVWSLERIGRDLAAAIWRPALGLAEVVLQRGKLLPHMGFTHGAKLYLFPEEAVYLVDRANLLLFLDPGRAQEKRLLSMQEAHDLLVGAGVGLDRYLVFCKLLRAGYIVQRHPARWALKPGEEPAAIWGAWGRAPGDAAAAAAAQAVGQGSATAAAAAAQLQQQAVSVPVLAAAPPPKRRRVEAQQPQQGWWAEEMLAVQQQHEQQKEVQPSAEVLQPLQEAQPEPQQQEQQEGQQEQQANGGISSGNTCLGLPWLAGCLPAGFFDSLPRCEVLPDARQRARDEFPCMVPLASIPLPDLLPLGGPAAGHGLLHYDVFQANAKFSRKQAGTPAYMVSVLPPSRLPTPEDGAAADAAAGGVPVRFSTIEKGDICFYGLTHVELRSILQ